MSILNFVKKKLEKDELCDYCVEGAIVSDQFVKTTRFICLIERQGDYALLLFASKSDPCRSENDLRLTDVFPVDENLRTQAEQPPKERPASQAAYFLAVQYQQAKLFLELPQGPNTSKFLGELKKAKDLQSQNAAFGLPSSFSWLEKYKKMVQGSPLPPKKDMSNPFATDVFDPLRHMQLDQVTSDGKAGPESAVFFDDTFGKTEFDSTKVRKSASKDSLDNLDGSGSYEFTESLDKIAERQLGLNTGEEIAQGLKPTNARETLVNYFLNEREKEFVDIEPLRVFCGTWNVNGQSPEDLTEWLSCDKIPPDIYAIGFQELDLSNQAYIFTDSQREADWQDAVKRYLHPRAKYRKVKSVRLVGVLLIVYIRDIHVGHVSLIDTDSVPTGILGLMGNKGGVGIRMSLQNTSLCFVNSHLAAHQDEFDRRNEDSRDIETRMRFKQFLPPLTIADHDLVFWIGDLNYRIDMEITKVKEHIKSGALNKLMPHDQLYRQLTTNIVYKTYKEGAINFPPTYKYDPGTDNFDTSEKSRIPAWCDRVLYKGEGIKQIVYRSHPTLKVSDHKPVSALFEVGIKVVDRTRYKKVYEDIMKKLDRLENDYLPQVTLAQKEFSFKDVKFIEPQEQILAIANIGQVPVTFEFINKLDENSYCKKWLKVTPFKAVITPGDSCEISLEVFVDKDSAYRLNAGEDKIEDILVLHLHGGKDFFIPISGNYIPSCFGTAIEALVQMHGPIRDVPTSLLLDLEQPGSLDKVDILKSGTRLYDCPKEIYRLVDHIYKYGRHQEDLFLQPGLNHDIQLIRDCLDTGSPDMIPGSIHSVAEALLLFLECLPEPVIPYKFYFECINCSNNFLLAKQVISKVPDCHRNVFIYLCALLRELLQHSEHNCLEVKVLATMFGDLFLRPPPQSAVKDGLSKASRRQLVRSEEMKRAGFVYHFLTNEYDE